MGHQPVEQITSINSRGPHNQAFERRLDNFWKEHELIFNYKTETSYNPVARTSANRRAGEND